MPKRSYTQARLARLKVLRAKRHKPIPRTSTSRVKKICQNIIDKNSEFKRFDDELSATSINNITNGQILWKGPMIVQGDTALQRDGNEVFLRKLKFNVMFKSVGNSNRVRLILVQYPQTIGSVGTLSDVLKDVTAQHVMISPWLKNGPVKYRILHNRIYQLGTKGVMDGSYKYQSFKIPVRFPKAGLKLHYDGPTTQVPDKNSLVLYCVADQALTGANMNICDMQTEAVFTDV
jgi:hypothetical protein